MRAKRVLGIYALILVMFLAGKTVLEYRRVSSALSNNQPQVLGVSQVRSLQNPPILPPYPILTQVAPKFAARYYALYDVESGSYLIEQDANKPVPLASTTKIMTTLLAIEQGDLDSIATVDEKSAWQIGSTVNLLPNEQITLKNLLYAALLNSGNDSAFSIADHISRQQFGGDQLDISWDKSIESFVQQMNDKADQLNLSSLNFIDPSGLDDDNIGSARDMAKLASIALESDTFKTMVGTAEATVQSVNGLQSHQLKNSNRLISEWQYPNAIGVKTGFTPAAGHNLIGAIKVDGHTLVAVVFNTYSDTVSASAEVARDIFDFAQRAIEWR